MKAGEDQGLKMGLFKRSKPAIQVLINGQEVLVAGGAPNMCIVAEVQLDFVTKCSLLADTDEQEALCEYRVIGHKTKRADRDSDDENLYTWQGLYPLHFDDEIIFRLISTNNSSPFTTELSSNIFAERIKECLIPRNKVSGLEVTIDDEQKVSTNGEKAESLMASLYLDTPETLGNAKTSFLLSGYNQGKLLLWSGTDGDPVKREVKICLQRSLT